MGGLQTYTYYLGETYTALQTGVADGMESPTTSMKDMKFYEVAKYCLLTNYMWGTFNLVINEDFLIEKGMVFNELYQEDAVKMREAIEPVIDKWGEDHGATELIKMLREEVQ